MLSWGQRYATCMRDSETARQNNLALHLMPTYETGQGGLLRFARSR